MIDNDFANRFIKARRQVISMDFAHLNDKQREAVMATEGSLLILAGAGSGKTTVLINRIANLLKYGRGSDCDFVPEYISENDLLFLESYIDSPVPENTARAQALSAVDPVEPWRVIAITFTNKAADELKARLGEMLGERANDIWARTFHSACVRILRRDIEHLGYDRSFAIYDTADSQSLMKRILKELELDDKTYPYRTVLTYISRAKDAMISAEDFYASAEASGDIRRKGIGRAYLEYSRRLKSANALDFDDLILLTVKLLLEYADVRQYYQKLFKYVLIDEYQDTNNLQYLLSSLLAGGYENICVVGDDDQSIYKFRGATVDNILNFESKYKNTRVILLERNYRSNGHILAASNSVIKHNRGRKGKSLWTEKDMGEKPVLHVAADEREEAQYVADIIIAGIASGNSWKDFAVLYRMNAQSNQMEFAFKRNAVPYRIVGGMRFFDRAEIKDMLSYLGVIENPYDDLRLLRIINVPARGIGQKTLDMAQGIAADESIPLYEVFKKSGEYEELKRAAASLHQFVNLIEDLRVKRDTSPLDSIYDELLERSGYIRMLQEKDSDENISRMENLGELKNNIVNFMWENPGGTLFDFLDEIALYTDMDQYDKNTDCVVMMTMHSAKGLEFPSVFIIGAEEGIFPGIRSIGEPDEMEEERRLCYVAMTRAEENLYITCARRRMLFGKTTAGQVSRFVEEIDADNIERPPAGASYDFEDIADSGFGGSSNYGRPRSRTSGYGYNSYRTAFAPGRKEVSPVPRPPAKPATVLFGKGDTVQHKAFGRGMITSFQPVGGDALIEIAFDESGTKRLMLKSAAVYMEKVEG